VVAIARRVTRDIIAPTIRDTMAGAVAAVAITVAAAGVAASVTTVGVGAAADAAGAAAGAGGAAAGVAVGVVAGAGGVAMATVAMTATAGKTAAAIIAAARQISRLIKPLPVARHYFIRGDRPRRPSTHRTSPHESPRPSASGFRFVILPAHAGWRRLLEKRGHRKWSQKMVTLKARRVPELLAGPSPGHVCHKSDARAQWRRSGRDVWCECHSSGTAFAIDGHAARFLIHQRRTMIALKPTMIATRIVRTATVASS
jgi:hypothetical protein